MYVFHDENGDILFTATGGVDIIVGRKNWIEIPQTDLGDLTAWQVRDGDLVLVTLDPAKRDAKVAVNNAIGAAREMYMTSLPGQEMVYLRKEQEARNWLGAENPDLVDYPLMQSEIGITADTPYQLAQVWLYMSHAWIVIASDMEGLRMGTAAKIDAATGTDQIAEVLAAFYKDIALYDNRL